MKKSYDSKFKSRVALEAAIPLSVFGTGAKVSGFNFGRNRTLHGGAQTFSLAPGREYRNFGVNLIRW